MKEAIENKLMSRQKAKYLKDTMLEDNEGDLIANNNKDDNEESSESPRFINIIEW